MAVELSNFARFLAGDRDLPKLPGSGRAQYGPSTYLGRTGAQWVTSLRQSGQASPAACAPASRSNWVRRRSTYSQHSEQQQTCPHGKKQAISLSMHADMHREQRRVRSSSYIVSTVAASQLVRTHARARARGPVRARMSWRSSQIATSLVGRSARCAAPSSPGWEAARGPSLAKFLEVAPPPSHAAAPTPRKSRVVRLRDFGREHSNCIWYLRRIGESLASLSPLSLSSPKIHTYYIQIAPDIK